MEITYRPTDDGFVEILIDGRQLGWARDEQAARDTVEQYQQAVREAAAPLVTALKALWNSYDGPTRRRFAGSLTTNA